MKDAYFIRNLQYKAAAKVDPLRVSRSISKNMLKTDGYGDNQGATEDIKLANRDTEIHFNAANDAEPKNAIEELARVDDKKVAGDELEVKEPKSGVESAILAKPKTGQSKRDDNTIRKDETTTKAMGLDPNAP